jgi:3-deoxy-D-manno-octulosonate 8-phosphate phosphatase (KDO 8-P phosphatase)
MMIEYLIMDVDGTLTDGKIYMGEAGEMLKAFNIKDGYGITHMRTRGIEPVILTGRKSSIVEQRSKELQIRFVFQGIQNKASFLKDFMEQKRLTKQQIAYIGDDDNDIEVMKECGIVGCPKDASKNVLAITDYISPNNGGDGAVRDFIEYIYEVNGELE